MAERKLANQNRSDDALDTRPPLVVLTGPTAAGKTALSIRLAQECSGEIVSADSVQVYRGMDIGSAKIRPEETQGIPHHLIDILEPAEPFDAFCFQRLAREAIDGIYERGHLPIVTGGTGFYIQALLRGVQFTEKPSDPAYREALAKIAREQGCGALHAMLREADPEYADALPPENVKRAIRALEYYHLTGEKLSVHNARERERPEAYSACYFVLTDDRAELYARIDARVDAMMGEGLLEEVRALREQGVTAGMTSMQAIGYKELYAYLDGECTLDEAVSRIKQNSRHFAKRQLTWFRREPATVWINRAEFGGDEERMLAFLLEKLSEKIGVVMKIKGVRR